MDVVEFEIVYNGKMLRGKRSRLRRNRSRDRDRDRNRNGRNRTKGRGPCLPVIIKEQRHFVPTSEDIIMHLP